MAPHELAPQGIGHLADPEPPRLRLELGVEEDLQQDVP